MRILFTSVAGIGHVHPLVPLAVALRDRGHEVHWATGPDAIARVAAIGFPTIAAGRAFVELQTQLRTRHPEIAGLAPEDLPDFVFPRLFGEVVPDSMIDAVVAAAETLRPELVVHDAAEFTGAIAAARIGVPSVTHGFGAPTPEHRVRDASKRVARHWQAAGLEPRPYGGSYAYLYLDIYPTGLHPAATPHIERIQPLRPVPFDDTGTDGAYDDFGDPARPLVYVTFGTVDRDPTALRTAVGAIATLDVRVLATVGPGRDPASIGAQPANVRIERYVPQTQVLRRCAVAVTHAGSGTFLAALGVGVPQLCLPQAADQFINAATCVRAGAGLALPPAEATPVAIASAVGRLLDDDAFRSRAADIAARIAAMPGPGEVAMVLEGVTSPA